MAGTVLFLPIAFIIGETRDGYSHISQGISALSEAWAQTSNFIIVGLLLIGLAVGLQRGIGESKDSILGPTLIALFGLLACIMNGVFPADPVGVLETSVGTAHSLTAGLGFIFVIVSMFVLPRRLQEHEDWRNLSALSRLFGIAVSFLMVIFLMAHEGSVKSGQPWNGLLQRGMGAAVMFWLFLLALRLFHKSRGKTKVRS